MERSLDLRKDPPPDLVAEIDVMHAVVNRERIYAKLQVPEMWVLRRDGRLGGFSLAGGRWKAIDSSLAFPFLRIDDLNPFVARIGVDDDTTVLADFDKWLRTLPRP